MHKFDHQLTVVRSKTSSAPLLLCVKSLTIAICLAFCGIARAQQPTPAEKAAPKTSRPAAAPAPGAKKNPANSKATDQLSVEQARLADRFKRLEEVIGRLAELSASTDPRRAKLLREAIAQSREQDINVRFESVVKLLQDERLSAAATNQTELQKELDSLLGLLLKADRDKELASQRERIRKYIKEVDRIIRFEKGLHARTEGGDEFKGLGEDQKSIAADTGKLGGDISKTDGDKKTAGDDAPQGDDKQKPKADGKSDPNQKKPGKPGDKQSGKPHDYQKPGDSKSDKSDDKQAPKRDDTKAPGSEKDKQDKPSKSDKPSKPGEQSKPGEKPSKSGKPDGKNSPSPPSKPSDGQPSEGQPSKSKGKPPSDSPPSPGQPGAQSPDEDNEEKQPQQPQDPADRAANRLRNAQQRMEDAQKKLEESQRKGATEHQQQALKELEQAKAELERVLRQLREEELERTLMQLAARFRKMLELQTVVYEGTVRLDKVPETQRTHDHEIESARLSRQESQIVHEVDKALLLLHEEGSSVAFPEAIEQMRDDMRQVTERLAALKVEKITQGLEKDIIGALEETIGALEQSLKKLEKKRTPPGQRPAAGQPDDMSLVDKIAELKMIRSLQLRINKRTQSYGQMIEGEEAETPHLIKALEGLAERQQRVYRATADLQQGRND